ncbi:MAG: D-alanyl-D-alanine carboxypeptidase [Bacilli bacterium]|nr:D-alanyl-D-alanine carboxypeptidase [Bacilli bacterium]
MKKVLTCIICLFMMIPFVNAEESNNENTNTLAPNAKSAILIEESTGEILYEYNSHEKLEPASMTKMMSLLLIMESIEKGVIDWDQMITVSANASGMGGSQILLETGEEMSVDDLVKGISIASGNDAVVALAEAIAGTEENFVKMMNDKLKELGLKDTNFKNCHGLDEEGHYSSAYDMAYIGRELVKHEKILEYSSIYEDYLREGTDRKIWLVNTNKLVRFKEGVDGLKTGYTDGAGYCLTATMKKNNMRVVATVMGEPDSSTRNNEVSSMLDYAFAQVGLNKVLSKKSVVDKITLSKSKIDEVEIVPVEDVNVLYKKVEGEITPTYEVELDEINAPIKKGDVVGTLYVKNNDKIINKVDLTVKKDVEKCNLIELYGKYLKNILSGNIKF